MSQRKSIEDNKMKDATNDELASEPKVYSSDGDYETGSIKWNEKMRIAKQITHLIFLTGKEVKIFNKDSEYDEVMTNIFNLNTEYNNFWTIIETGITTSLVNENGTAGIRLAGDIYNPKAYLTSSLVIANDIMDSNKIVFLQSQFRTIRGSMTNISTDYYDWRTNKLTTNISSQFSKNGRKYTTTISKDIKYMPYVIFQPTLNNDLEPVSVFWYVEPYFDLLDKSYRQVNVRLEKANFYILPHKNMFQGASPDGGLGWMGKLFNKVIIPLKDKLKGIDNNEAFSIIDPDQGQLTTTLQNKRTIRQEITDEMGIQDIEFQGSYQKNDREVEMLKQKEYNLIKRLTTYFKSNIESIINLLLPEGYYSELELKGHEILNKELEHQKTMDKQGMGAISPDEAKEEIEGQ